jgi:hypothetical protein
VKLVKNTFKFSTFVLKMTLFSFIAASFVLMTAKVQAKSENAKMIDQHVRLSLWYTGIQTQQIGESVDNNHEAPEELVRAMNKLKVEQKDR